MAQHDDKGAAQYPFHSAPNRPTPADRGSGGGRRSNRPRPATAMVLTVMLLAGFTLAPVPSETSVAEAAESFTAQGSVEQIWVTGAAPESAITVIDSAQNTVAEASTDAAGSIIFRNLDPGSGYRVRQNAGTGPITSAPLTVLSTRSAPPDPDTLYGQPFVALDPASGDGYGYLTMRDGIELAVSVNLPGTPEDGPYPTVLTYSGYEPANPAVYAGFARILNLLGYATVGVNMRGTGCSGGGFDFFEPLQSTDGYDVIETIARQPWVAHDKVGMVGLSYPGMAQLWVAATQPPSLAAIAPLSVLDDTAATLYPGGILNNGFALTWGKDRVQGAQPAGPDSGQPWAWDRIQGTQDGQQGKPDTICAANQALHSQAADLVEQVGTYDHYVPAVSDPLAPATFVDRINVPTYLACQWQDAQVGPHCPAMVPGFTGTDKAWFTFTNGTHVDSLVPTTFLRWYDFLEIYVAQRAPSDQAQMRAIMPDYLHTGLLVDNIEIPADPIADAGEAEATPAAAYQAAKAAFEAQPRVRVLLENGAGGATVGNPAPAGEVGFDSFPPNDVTAQSWYLGADGTLSTEPSATPGADSWNYDPTARPSTSFDGLPLQLRMATPEYNWKNLVPDKAAAYLSPPLSEDTLTVGTAGVDLWLRSTAPDTDLQVTLTEVRPDGKEMFVQNGWLRASKRALDTAASTPIGPVQTFAEADEAPLPQGEWSKTRVQIYPFGHVFHAGSRIRISIEAPGGDQPMWTFATLDPAGAQRDMIGYGPAKPARLVLPVVPGAAVPATLPGCPSLRAQPCRDYDTAWANTPVDLDTDGNPQNPGGSGSPAPAPPTSGSGPAPAATPMEARPTFTG